MAIKVRLRLPVPEGKAGSTVTVSEERAKLLVDNRYAAYVEGVEADSAQASSVGTADEAEQAPVEPASTTDYTTLPSTGDLKEEWENAATALNIDLQREDGSDKSKAELIKEVQAAVGADE